MRVCVGLSYNDEPNSLYEVTAFVEKSAPSLDRHFAFVSTLRGRERQREKQEDGNCMSGGAEVVICSPHASQNSVRVMKSRKTRWAWHAARIVTLGNAYDFLVGKPEVKPLFANQGVDGRVMLNWTLLKKRCERCIAGYDAVQLSTFRRNLLSLSSGQKSFAVTVQAGKHCSTERWLGTCLPNEVYMAPHVRRRQSL